MMVMMMTKLQRMQVQVEQVKQTHQEISAQGINRCIAFVLSTLSALKNTQHNHLSILSVLEVCF